MSWIPRALGDFAGFCRRWKGNLENRSYITAFGFPAAEVTLCVEKLDAFLSALAAWEEVDSSLNKGLRDEARKEAAAAAERFATLYIRYNEKMSEAQRLDLFGVITKHAGSPIPVPHTVPVIVPRQGHARQVLLDYRDQGSAKRGKPSKVHGIEVRWALLDHAPSGVEELTHSSFDTRPPLSLSFGEADRGKRVYFAGRWEINREGAKGDFGEIGSELIP
jgi:hypothetical protein